MASEKTKSYKSLRKQLDETLEWFEGEDLDIDEALTKYKEAISLAKQLEDYLSNAENKLKELRTELPD